MANKVKFGLSNCVIAPITNVGDSSYTYGTCTPLLNIANHVDCLGFAGLLFGSTLGPLT